MRFRSHRKNKVKKYFSRGLIIIIVSLICSFVFINYFSKKVDKILFPMAETKLRKIVSTLINESTENIEFDKKLFSLVKDDSNEIKMINYDSYEVTKLINEVTSNIEGRLDKIYEDNSNKSEFENYIVQEIPFGSIMNSSLLNGLGPKIKIKSKMVGSIISNIETEVKPYGINNAYIETRIYLEVRAKIFLPFVTEEIKISNVIPISMNIVQGNVPEGYITSYK